MILSFVVDYAKMCAATKSVQHFLCIQDILLKTIKPLLSEWSGSTTEHTLVNAEPTKQELSGIKFPKSADALKTVLKFLFAVFKLPNFLSVMFMLNDFLVFRTDQVLELFKLVFRCCSDIASHIPGEEVFTSLQGLRFDCSILLSVFRPNEGSSNVGEMMNTNAETTLPKDEMFTKVVYVLKQEISSSTVSDHQNSLGYNGRDQVLIREFFETLLQLLLTFDQFCYHDLLIRLCRFPCEVLMCCHDFVSKVLPQFGRDTRQALYCLNISAVHAPGTVYSQYDNRPWQSDSAVFNVGYLTAVLFRATQKILQSIGLDFKEQQMRQLAQKNPQMKLDQQILSSIIDVQLGTRNQGTPRRIGSKNRLPRRCSENLLLHESPLYRTSITERYHEFIVENFILRLDK